MPPEDDVRLRHLVDAAERAVQFTAGRSRSDLDTDEMLTLALTKLVEIVGEAAKQVSAETQDAYPAVPWSAAARMRDRLVHRVELLVVPGRAAASERLVSALTG